MSAELADCPSGEALLPDDAKSLAVQEEGPDIRELTRHFAQCPPSFLEEPQQPSGQGGVHVDAVLSDLMLAMGGPRLTDAEAKRFRYASKEAVRGDRNRLRIALLAGWLFSHQGLRGSKSAALARVWLSRSLEPLAKLIAADDLVHDSERREEFARLGLAALHLRPLGESEAQAQDRLTALSTVERERMIAQSRAAEERAGKVRRELLEKQRAQAAASVYSNE